jgi:hypothetical protein
MCGCGVIASTLDGDEWSVSRPGRFTAGEILPGTHSIEDMVSPKAGLNTVEKEKDFSCRKSKPYFLFCFICGLFNDTISSSDNVGRKRLWPIILAFAWNN